MCLFLIMHIAIGLLGLALGLTALAIGIIFAAGIIGTARNPEAESKLSKYVFVGGGLAEALGLFAFVVILLLLFVVK